MGSSNKYETWKEKQIAMYQEFMNALSGGTEEFLYLLDLQSGRVWLYGGVEDVADLGEKRPDGSYRTEQWMATLHHKDRPLLKADIEMLMSGKKLLHDLDYRVLTRDERWLWVNCKGTVKQDSEGNPVFLIGRISYTSLRYRVDTLTGLFNEEQFSIDLKKVLVNPKGYLMLLGVDNMKAINTAQGRMAGDQFLKQLASVLEYESFGQKVYRLYGDTFAILLFDNSEKDLKAMFSRVQNSLPGQTTISGGIVPMDLPDVNFNKLVQYSEFVLRQAKLSGKNMLEFFRPEDYKKEERSVSLLDELKESVYNNDCAGFSLVYQPQFYTEDCRLSGAEALLRYESPTRGEIFPDEFVPLLERDDLIYTIGLWVFRKALAQCVEWRKYCPEFRISVNISYLQLKRTDITREVLNILEESGLPGNALTIEVTESMQLQKYEYFNDIFATWKSSGISISVDDFGTGYSGLSYLKNLSVDEVKIDRCFVSGIDTSNYNYTLMRNIIQLAESAQIRVCCEGIEEVNELRVIQKLNPDLLQGYLFSKPCKTEQFENYFLKKDSPEYKDYTHKVQSKRGHSLKIFLKMQHFEIFRSLSMGLWMLCVADDGRTRELHIDENTRRLFGFPNEFSARGCYLFWKERIYPADRRKVSRYVKNAFSTNKVVRINYRWNHPERGLLVVESAGVRTESLPGEYCLQGYHWDCSAMSFYREDTPASSLWNFFEHFGEIVYVADMDTYEMIYLNQAGLRAYDCADLSEVVGKKCYEFLQGNSEPCAMCTNRRLREGEFVDWYYFNLVLKKSVHIKDTMLMDGNRRCRLEFAIVEKGLEPNLTMDELAQNAFNIALQAATPDQSLDVMLEYLGHALCADRIYVFEQNCRGNYDNTYEWVSKDVSHQIDNLKELPPEVGESWSRAFEKGETVIIRDLEEIKDSDPLVYEVLKPQNIHSLVAGPLYDDGKIIGFYGVDNPPKEYLGTSSTIIKIMGHFTSMFLKMRNLVNELRHMSWFDYLTKIGNRYALTEKIDKMDKNHSLGVIFCDVTGLKKINDTCGHQAGDELLFKVSRVLVQSFSENCCFRWGGDEFVVLADNLCTEQEFLKKVDAMRTGMSNAHIVIATGFVWHSQGAFDVYELLGEAEKKMYQQKREFYRCSPASENGA